MASSKSGASTKKSNSLGNAPQSETLTSTVKLNKTSQKKAVTTLGTSSNTDQPAASLAQENQASVTPTTQSSSPVNTQKEHTTMNTEIPSFVKDSTDQAHTFTKEATDRLGRFSKDYLAATTAAGEVITKASDEISGKVLEAIDDSFKSTVSHVSSLASSRDPQDLVYKQLEFARVQSAAALQQAQQFSQLFFRTTVDAAKPINASYGGLIDNS